MVKNICFYNDVPLVQRDFERYGFEVFLSRGFQVSYLDMTRVFHSDYLANYEPPNVSDYHGVVIARNHDDILNFIETNQKAFAIVLHCYNRRTRLLFKAFKKYDIQYAQLESVSLPIWSTFPPAHRFRRFWQEARQFHFAFIGKAIGKIIAGKVAAAIDGLMQTRWGGVQPPRYSVQAARKYIRIGPRPGRNTEVIWGHYLDYDLYLEKRRAPEPPPSPYCVFLDEYFPFHPDFFTYGESPLPISAARYYEGLHRFFSFVEERMQMPVVIAAHPRARYDQHPDYFRGRRVEQFKTIDVVSQAPLVLLHESRSANFAVMYRKPVIFLTSDELEKKTVYGSFIRNFAAALGKKPINMDREIDCDPEKECVVDEQKYQEYFVNYIKIPGTPEKPFWEIVADKIEADQFSSAGEASDIARI